jgi:hypothetical protein
MIPNIQKYRCWGHLCTLLLAMKSKESTGISDMDVVTDPDLHGSGYTIISDYIHPYTTFEHIHTTTYSTGSSLTIVYKFTYI